jgi:hypothetical protein
MAGLFGSSVLEVVIGLSFIYFLLSLICSNIHEILAGALKLRAQDLEKGIRNLLCDPDLAQLVLKHPLIKAMGNSRAEVVTVRMLAGESEESSWIAKLLGALSTLLGALSTWARQQFRRPVLSVYPTRSGQEEKKDFAGKPSYIDAHTFTQALLDQFAPATDGSITVDRIYKRAQEMLAQGMEEIRRQVMVPVEIQAAMLKPINEIRTAVDQAPPGPQKDAVLKYIDTEKPTLGQFAQYIQQQQPNLPQELRGAIYLPSIESIAKILNALPSSGARDEVLEYIKKNKTVTTDELTKFAQIILPPSAKIQEAINEHSFEALLDAVLAFEQGPARTAMLRMIDENPKITISRSMLSMMGNTQGAQKLFTSIEELKRTLKNEIAQAE